MSMFIKVTIVGHEETRVKLRRHVAGHEITCMRALIKKLLVTWCVTESAQLPVFYLIYDGPVHYLYRERRLISCIK